MSTRIGILTGGGDCPGLNTVIATVVTAAAKRGWETLGFIDGYEGLINPVRCMVLPHSEMEHVEYRGGTILKTTNRGRFAAKVGQGQAVRVPEDLLDEAKSTVEYLGLKALVCVGGDGSLSIAQQLFERGVPVVGVPKTIDNDLDATAWTFGFDSAVACATDALDRLRTTAESHDRVMVLEVMGRYAGWIALYAGMAGGADAILIPEIPFSYDSVVDIVRARERDGLTYTIVVVAEGARERGGDLVTDGSVQADREVRLGGIGARVSRELAQRTGRESRVVVLGHLQRGGSPTNFDRVLCSLYGTNAVELVAARTFGHMVAMHAWDIVSVPIAAAIGRLRTVPLDSAMIRSARALGISLGD
ncbi:MAG: ATP-dependent 6-phosphofructokinase [Acidobacteriota bacterium]